MKKNYIEEYVEINSINHYILHYPSVNLENPILLFLHGGPGQSESIFSYYFQNSLEDIFTVVHYDQRGAGKTYLKNKCIPTAEEIIEDLFGIIKYLKQKYNNSKIVILGHPWGSVLGTLFIKKYKGEAVAYIGVGQVINMMENETVGYNVLKEKIIESKNKKDLIKLESIGKYPEKETLKQKVLKVRALQSKYKLAFDIFKMLSVYIKSPFFNIKEIFVMAKSFKTNDKILDFLFDYDIYKEEAKYSIPIFYIMGENDFQTPITIAEKYFNNIEAPQKKFFTIKNAAHMTMIDNVEDFNNALKEIRSYIN